MARSQPSVAVTIGDPMPRITLPLASGGLFDSWDPTTAGMARVYWLGDAPTPAVAEQLSKDLVTCETLLHIVAPVPPEAADGYPSWLLDRGSELKRAFGTSGPFAILVDSAGRVAAVPASPTPDSVMAMAGRLFMASTPTIVQAKAPVLLLERVVEPDLCTTLIEYWRHSEKLSNTVGSSTGNVVNPDIKRRHDVQVNDPKLFVQLRDCVVRRVLPPMQQAFHARINVIEAPLIGCYDVSSGGWFRAHRDNTSSHNAHRQYALTLNLNSPDEYDGAAVRFPEFGRELYCPAAGGALVFSCSLLHEVMPVSRGRRFGAFTFLSPAGPAVTSGPSAGRSALATTLR